jgi:hypothetical protein
MFEQVRGAGVPDRLVAAADVVHDGEGQNRRDAILDEKNAQAVGDETELSDAGLLLDELELACASSEFGVGSSEWGRRFPTPDS